MENVQKLELIKKSINSANIFDTFGKKAKKQKIEYYSNRINDLNRLSIEQIEKHNFNTEIINFAYELRKLNLVDKKLYKNIVSIEVHKYAPELNKVLFNNNIGIKCNNVTNIEDALTFIVKNLGMEQIENLIKETTKK
jgi:hypothetical protein